MLRRFILKLRRRARLERDIDAELAFHRSMSGERGNPIPLGNVARIREASRDSWRFRQFEDLLRDLVYAARQLGQRPGFTGAVVFILALGIGINATVFSLADGVLFQRFPYGDPDGLAVLLMQTRPAGQVYASVPDEFMELVREAESVAGIGILGPAPQPVIEGPEGPETIPAIAVTPEYFALLGVEAFHGRLFDTADADGGRPAMLAHEAWQVRFGGDPEVVGRPLSCPRS